MKLTEREKNVLAILFASGEPIEITRLAESLELGFGEITDAAASITEQMAAEDSPLELRRLNDSYQLCTTAAYAPIIRRALEIKRNIPLSPAAMETLAIIAYNQPVTRGFVEQVRGVDSSSIVVALVEKGLAEEAGRMDLPGRPLAYRTTANFLRCFGLESLNQLPSVDEQQEQEDEATDPEEQITFGELQ